MRSDIQAAQADDNMYPLDWEEDSLLQMSPTQLWKLPDTIHLADEDIVSRQMIYTQPMMMITTHTPSILKRVADYEGYQLSYRRRWTQCG